MIGTVSQWYAGRVVAQQVLHARRLVESGETGGRIGTNRGLPAGQVGDGVTLLTPEREAGRVSGTFKLVGQGSEKRGPAAAGETVRGTKTFRYPIIPQADGKYVIAPVRIASKQASSSSFSMKGSPTCTLGRFCFDSSVNSADAMEAP